MDKKKVAFIASRLKCVDGLCVESEKWIKAYIKQGYDVQLIAGKIGEPTDLVTHLIADLDYKHPEVRAVKRLLFGAILDKNGKKPAQMLLNNLVNRIRKSLKPIFSKEKI